jgi:hypothetical protein
MTTIKYRNTISRCFFGCDGSKNFRRGARMMLFAYCLTAKSQEIKSDIIGVKLKYENIAYNCHPHLQSRSFT